MKKITKFLIIFLITFSAFSQNLQDTNTKEKEKATKQIVFWNLPNILIVTLKRFNNNNEKNDEMIDFPLENFDLSQYVVGYNKDSYKYDLFGICNHSGGVSGGHYTSFVKNANGSWYHFNDTSVNKLNESSVKTNMAYCFFYRKKILQ